VAASFHAVATSPVMPRWEEYRARIERERSLSSRFEEPTSGALVDVLRARRLVPRPALDVVGSLVSFVDDHRRPFPRNCFPAEEATALFDRLREKQPHSVSPSRLFTLALDLTNDAFGALLACHLATRQLARGRDTRAFANTPISLEERCDVGLAIAPFPPGIACGGDPLGDTYHYFANVIAGVLSTSQATWGRAIAALFYAGPDMMHLVRGRISGRRLFFGNHAQVDRMGLAHGMSLADHARQPS
jgi:hypothetical protein